MSSLIGSTQSGSSSSDTASTSAGTGNAASSWSPNESVSAFYSNIIENLGSLATTETPYYQGQTYVEPSSNTQAGVTGLEQSANSYNNAATAYGNVSNSYNNAQNAYDQAAQPYQGVAQAYNQAAQPYNQAAQSYGQAAGAQQGTLNQGNQNYGFLSNAADVSNNQYVQAMNANTASNLNENLYENILPQVNQGAQSVNAMGSSRQGLMQGQAIGDTQQAIANAQTDTNLQAYNTGIGAQQEALGQTGAMLENQTAPAAAHESAGNALAQGAANRLAGANAGVQGADTVAAGADAAAQGASALTSGAEAQAAGAENSLTAGSTVEEYQQAAVDDAVARHNYQYEEPWERISNVANYLTGLFGDTGTSYTSETSGSQNVGASDSDTGGSSGLMSKI